MPGGIDVRKRKARQLRNTPAHRYINIRSFLVLAGCSLFGVLMSQGSGIKKFQDKYMSEEAREKERIEQEERQLIFRDSIAPQRSAKDIQKVLDHKAKYDFET